MDVVVAVADGIGIDVELMVIVNEVGCREKMLVASTAMLAAATFCTSSHTPMVFYSVRVSREWKRKSTSQRERRSVLTKLSDWQDASSASGLAVKDSSFPIYEMELACYATTYAKTEKPPNRNAAIRPKVWRTVFQMNCVLMGRSSTILSVLAL